MTRLEIACFNEASALKTIHENIDRIELCEDYSLGGITPKISTLQKIKTDSSIPVFVMIRPRGNDFCYSEKEFELMKQQIIDFKNAGADGFVFGILSRDNKVEINKNKELVELADGLPCTFHRAFDRVENWQEALEDVISCGFSTILTAGGKKTAMEGLEILKLMEKEAKNRISILVGGGVRSNNAKELSKNFKYLHSACVQKNSEEVDVEEIRKIKNKIN